MPAGPIFRREALTAPRSVRHFLLRSGYVLALFVLLYTAEKAVVGLRSELDPGEGARFGALAFQVLASVQLTLVLFFSLVFTAGNISQEKDRQTLLLLLMTDLRNRELVLGKLAASLLTVFVLVGCGAPVFLLVRLLGGVELGQVFWFLALCCATAVAAGSWGALVAFWREKTFQTLAVGVIGLVAFLAGLEAVIAAAGADSAVGRAAGWLEPYRTLVRLVNPLAWTTGPGPATASALFPVLALLGLAGGLTGVSVWKLRVWNPSKSVHDAARKAKQAADVEARREGRTVWENPVLWREVRTRAYGRRVFLIRAAFVALCVAAGVLLAGTGNPSAEANSFAGVNSYADGGEAGAGLGGGGGLLLAGLGLLGLILVNAQAVTALTTERDGRTLELLLATDLSAKEFTVGKLAGVLYNSKELIVAPLLLAAFLAARGLLGWEALLYVALGYLTLAAFVAALGLHAAAAHGNSRRAIAHSLGTVFFLFVGLGVFLLLLVEARSSFFVQFQGFLLFIGFGSALLLTSLNWNRPSAALTLAGLTLPFLTFYAITSVLLGSPLAALLAVVAGYGFATAAMLVPAVSDFGIELGGRD